MEKIWRNYSEVEGMKYFILPIGDVCLCACKNLVLGGHLISGTLKLHRANSSTEKS